MSWRSVLTLAGVALVAAALAGTASAGKPVMERVDVDETVLDEFLTEECGFDVIVTFKGHLIFRTFEDDGKGLVSLTTLNVLGTATANGNTLRIRDVGADKVRIAPDGTAILSIIGQVPFGLAFHGVLKVNLDTGEVIHEPQHTTGGVEAACAALAA